MNDLAAQVMLNAVERYRIANARGKRKAKARRAAQAAEIRENPEGYRSKEKPWNDIVPYAGMRLYLSEGARETLRMLKK